MSWIAVAVAGGTLAGGLISSHAQKSAAETASNAQTQSAQLGIDEQRHQFDAIQKLLAPYVQAGQPALTGQQNILGLNGTGAQQEAINGIQSSPMFDAMARQGEDAILANASATGGLRGGNVQGSLAQFRPALLNQLIEQQYARLGGMTQMGQNSAAGVGTAGMSTGNNISQLLQQQGAAQAGGALAAGRADAGLGSAISSGIGSFAGLGGFGGGAGVPAYDAGALRAGVSPPRAGGSYMDFNYQQTPIQIPAAQIPGF